jgi:hypothetical protein
VSASSTWGGRDSNVPLGGTAKTDTGLIEAQTMIETRPINFSPLLNNLERLGFKNFALLFFIKISSWFQRKNNFFYSSLLRSKRCKKVANDRKMAILGYF